MVGSQPELYNEAGDNAQPERDERGEQQHELCHKLTTLTTERVYAENLTNRHSCQGGRCGSDHAELRFRAQAQSCSVTFDLLRFSSESVRGVSCFCQHTTTNVSVVIFKIFYDDVTASDGVDQAD